MNDQTTNNPGASESERRFTASPCSPFTGFERVPENDEEAEQALRYGKDALNGASLAGIFRCRRSKGETLTRSRCALIWRRAIRRTRKVSDDAA